MHVLALVTQKGEIQNVDAVEIAVSPQTQSVIIRSRSGRTWKDDGNQWQPFLDHAVTGIAYPG